MSRPRRTGSTSVGMLFGDCSVAGAEVGTGVVVGVGVRVGMGTGVTLAVGVGAAAGPPQPAVRSTMIIVTRTLFILGPKQSIEQVHYGPKDKTAQ